MAWDIFFSYSHLDNNPLSVQDQGSISLLHKDLETRVTQLRGRAVSFWRDSRLEGNNFFATTIEDTLSDCQLLIAFISPLYLNSEWCQRELRAFLRAAGHRISGNTGHLSRVFPVLLEREVKTGKLPPPFPELNLK
jgi:hypothetical protein